MKKIISIFVMALLCAFCLVACEDNKKPDPNEGDTMAPGPPKPMAVATPTILPVPTRPDKAIAKA